MNDLNRSGFRRRLGFLAFLQLLGGLNEHSWTGSRFGGGSTKRHKSPKAAAKKKRRRHMARRSKQINRRKKKGMKWRHL